MSIKSICMYSCLQKRILLLDTEEPSPTIIIITNVFITLLMEATLTQFLSQYHWLTDSYVIVSSISTIDH